MWLEASMSPTCMKCIYHDNASYILYDCFFCYSCFHCVKSFHSFKALHLYLFKSFISSLQINLYTKIPQILFNQVKWKKQKHTCLKSTDLAMSFRLRITYHFGKTIFLYFCIIGFVQNLSLECKKNEIFAFKLFILSIYFNNIITQFAKMI